MSYMTTDNLRDQYQHIGFYLVDEFPDIDEENMGYEEIDEALIKSVNDDTTDIVYLFIGDDPAFREVHKLVYITLPSISVHDYDNRHIDNPLFIKMNNNSVSKCYYKYTSHEVRSFIKFINDESPQTLGGITAQTMPLSVADYIKFYKEMANLCQRAIDENKKICAYIHEFEQD